MQGRLVVTPSGEVCGAGLLGGVSLFVGAALLERAARAADGGRGRLGRGDRRPVVDYKLGVSRLGGRDLAEIGGRGLRGPIVYPHDSNALGGDVGEIGLVGDLAVGVLGAVAFGVGSIKDVSEFLGIPVQTLYQWWHQGTGPKAYPCGKRLRYSPAEVHRWLIEEAA